VKIYHISTASAEQLRYNHFGETCFYASPSFKKDLIIVFNCNSNDV